MSHQRQDLNQADNEGNISSDVALDTHFLQQHTNHHLLLPMSNFEVTELTWKNGQLAMHELGGIFPAPTTSITISALPKASWGGGVDNKASDTLESIVQQATYYNTQQLPKLMPASAPRQSRENVESSVLASSGGKWAENSGHIQTNGVPPPPPPAGLVKKRTHSESENCAARNNTNDLEMSACASANAAFSKDTNNNNNSHNNDTTMMTWASFESPRNCTRTKTTTDEDSACHGGSENQEEERETKGETGRSYTTRKGRAAAVHNQSERRRRDRINQKMKALQKLVPNANKTDKASMLDEVIEYLKQLQAQVQMMTSARFMPQLMFPLGMQQHLHQMSLLARVGMGIGMIDVTTMNGTHPGSQALSGMTHPNQVATAASPFLPPAFVVPQMISAPKQQLNSTDPETSNSAALQDPYSALFAQSMNIELYNKMAALQRQQQQQQTASQQTSSELQLNHRVQRS